MPIAGDIQALVDQIRTDRADRAKYLKGNKLQVKNLLNDIRGFMAQVKSDRETRKKETYGMLNAAKKGRKEEFAAYMQRVKQEKLARADWVKGTRASTRDYAKSIRDDFVAAKKAWAMVSKPITDTQTAPSDPAKTPPTSPTPPITSTPPKPPVTTPPKKEEQKETFEERQVAKAFESIKKQKDG
jgi:hypothetical protein